MFPTSEGMVALFKEHMWPGLQIAAVSETKCQLVLDLNC